MLRSLLVGLDGSPHSESAVTLGIHWAKRFDAELIGIAVVTEPSLLSPEATPMGASYLKGQRDQEQWEEAQVRVQGWLSQFLERCTQAGVACQALSAAGNPVEQIALQAQRYDVILMGQQTCFRSGDPARPDDCLEELLRRPPRPVIAVPATLPAGETIVVAYDGSVEAARALAGFHASGIDMRYETHVITLANNMETAARIAERAVDYLTRHAVQAHAHPLVISGTPGAQLVREAERLRAQLLVMGAFSHSSLHEFFFGSTTRTVLKASSLPLFLSN
ncbi:MAG: universal stress protein [Bacteroidales bacterium]|nr:universal stress protein [Bacteroidales bacterium]